VVGCKVAIATVDGGGRRRRRDGGARERIWGNRLCLEGWFREVRDLRGLSENESCAREGGQIKLNLEKYLSHGRFWATSAPRHQSHGTDALGTDQVRARLPVTGDAHRRAPRGLPVRRPRSAGRPRLPRLAARGPRRRRPRRGWLRVRRFRTRCAPTLLVLRVRGLGRFGNPRSEFGHFRSPTP
jgi:hypothetical protein